MQNAGRILLMPKGDYAAGTTYEMLDLVNHGGASWVCKKSCTGQTPSDTNTEYWQRFGTAVDLSNYLLSNGGTAKNFTIGVNGSIGVPAAGLLNSDGTVAGYLGISYGELRRWDTAFKPYAVLDTSNMANHVLPLTSTTAKTLAVQADTVLKVKNTGSGDYTWFQFFKGDTSLGYFGFNKNKEPLVSIDSMPRTLLHTGNKPTGTYTGNGVDALRSIAVGGLANGVIVYGPGRMAVVTFGGYVGHQSGNVKAHTTTYFDEQNEALCVGSHDVNFLNENGVQYKYFAF